jgi:hypothetical protein
MNGKGEIEGIEEDGSGKMLRGIPGEMRGGIYPSNVLGRFDG